MPVLNSISEIRMGATLRGRDATRPDPNGSYRFIRIGDISQEGTFKPNDFIRIQPNEKVNPELLLRSGDVLFPNRGTRTTAIAYRSDDDPTIVGAQFFIVRPDTIRLLPEYLAWYLRSEEVARHFDARRKGSYIKIIQRSDLAELEIPVPSLETQNRIVEINKLSLQERELLTRIQTRRQSLMEAMLREAVHRRSPSSRSANRSKKTKPVRKS